MSSTRDRLIAAARAANVPCVWIRNVYNTGPNHYLSEVWLEQAKRRRNGAYVQYPRSADRGGARGERAVRVDPQRLQYRAQPLFVGSLARAGQAPPQRRLCPVPEIG